MSWLDRIAACNTYDLGGFRPFDIQGRRRGWLRHEFAEHLRAYPDVFIVTETSVTLAPDLDTFETRSAVVETLVKELASAGVGGVRTRSEDYGVKPDWSSEPDMRLNRGAVQPFGVRAFGVHVNGFVRDGDAISMWVARRARDKSSYPGRLDNMVAGGQPIGLGLLDNVIKEAGEEAGVSAGLAALARPVGLVTYAMEVEEGLKPDTMFCFDLEVSADFVPRPVDGEAEGFTLLPLAEVAEIVRDTDEFKTNCNLVVIDFLIRHGRLTADGEPDYARLVTGLRANGELIA